MPDRLIVDGYNLMYADEELKSLMREDLEVARDRLLALVEDYCAREERRALVVFDAGGVPALPPPKTARSFLRLLIRPQGRPPTHTSRNWPTGSPKRHPVRRRS